MIDGKWKLIHAQSVNTLIQREGCEVVFHFTSFAFSTIQKGSYQAKIQKLPNSVQCIHHTFYWKIQPTRSRLILEFANHSKKEAYHILKLTIDQLRIRLRSSNEIFEFERIKAD